MSSQAEPMTPKPETAPWFHVPNQRAVSIEHPCIVKNTDRAVNMIGGATALSECLEEGSKKSLGLSFRPADPASKKIISFNLDTNNVLLNITVPKRTGRKRKRGSDEPFLRDTTESAARRGAQYLLRSMQDNPGRYAVDPVGKIESTHIWRSMPDFVYSTAASTFLDSIRTNILPKSYPLMQKWSLPRTYGLTDTEVIPPPSLSGANLPFNYSYRQNPAVKTIVDPGNSQKSLYNTQAPSKTYIEQCKDDDTNYPTAPPADCPPLESQSLQIKRVHEVLLKLFEERPIWTRRALINNLPSPSLEHFVRFALHYVAYAIRSGPWRDTLVKHGVDPRKDPKYRKYQTIMLHLNGRDANSSSKRNKASSSMSRPDSSNLDKDSHIFTSITQQSPRTSGKIWQLCDIHDPQLQDIINLPDLYIRAVCETRYFGWYANGSMAKLRVGLKAKLDALQENEALDEDAMTRFLSLPEEWSGNVDKDKNDDELSKAYLPKDAQKKELAWTSAYRSICRAELGRLPNSGGGGVGRMSKSRPKLRPSYLGPSETASASASGSPQSQEFEESVELEEDPFLAEEEEQDGYDNDVRLEDGGDLLEREGSEGLGEDSNGMIDSNMELDRRE